MVKFLKTKADFDTTLKSPNLVVVDFTASWCPPCKAISPVVDAMAEEHKDVVFVKVDVDENNETAESCGISCMPTFQFYRDGVKIHELQGANQDALKQQVKEWK